MPRTADKATQLRLVLVGGRTFSRRLTRALASVPAMEVVDVAATPTDASSVTAGSESDVLLVEATLADAFDSSMPQGRVVLAPWVVKWREADETASIARVDVITAAVLLSSTRQSTPPS